VQPDPLFHLRSDLQHISSPSPTPYWLLANFNYQNFFDEVLVFIDP
jgi:hypothetical protein